MNVFREYANLLRKGIENADQVFDGAKGKILKQFKLLSNDKKEEIIRRMDICSKCPYNSDNATYSDEYKALFGKHYEHVRFDTHCSLCGCNLELKTASLSSACGIRTHNQANAHNPRLILEEKWIEYEK